MKVTAYQHDPWLATRDDTGRPGAHRPQGLKDSCSRRARNPSASRTPGLCRTALSASWSSLNNAIPPGHGPPMTENTCRPCP